MGSGVNDSLAKLLLQRIEGPTNPVLWGSDLAPFVGKALDQLIAAGILAERAPASSWGPCRRCDGSCGERAVLRVSGRLVAECPVYPDLATALSDLEIRSFVIDARALISRLAGASGLGSDCEEIARDMWLLGEIGGQRHIVLALNDFALSGPDSLTLLGARLSPLATTLLVPSKTPAATLRPFRDAKCLVVRAAEAIADGKFAFDQIKLVPKVTATVRLSVNRAARTFVLDGRRLALADQPARLLMALAETARMHPGFMTQVAVQKAVYGDNRQPDARPLRDIVRDLRDQMADGLTGEQADLIRNLLKNQRTERYRLALAPEEIDFTG